MQTNQALLGGVDDKSLSSTEASQIIQHQQTGLSVQCQDDLLQGIVSHWVDWDMWQRVREYFVEAEEGDWVCSEQNAAAVEEALEILPENHWKTVRYRKVAEKAAEEHL